MSRRPAIALALASMIAIVVASAVVSAAATPRLAADPSIAPVGSTPSSGLATPAGAIVPVGRSAPGRASTPAPTTPAPGAPSADPSPAPFYLSPPAPTGPMPGDLLIADRGNDRLLIVTPDRHVVWSMTIDPGGPRGSRSLGPDDAFFTPDGRHIVVNQENAHTILIVDIATRRIVWRYGHSGVAGRAPGYLNGPDDAYQLPDGTVTVADIRNDRILFISPSGTITHQYGMTGVSAHAPPGKLASPNGDVPLPDGGMLVTEIGGRWVDRLSARGRVLWRVHLRDIAYPSDAQLLPDGNILVVDYSTPGRVEEVTPKGRVAWRYFVRSGPGMLSHPSLAVRLSNGNVAVTGDFNQTVVVIDPLTNRIVWTYGHRGVAGTALGYLSNPDGLDPVPAAVAAWLGAPSPRLGP